MELVIYELTILCSFLVLGWGLNFTWGYGGLFNLGIIGTMSVGAYAHVILQRETDMPFGITLVGGVAAAAFVGWIGALLTRRIRREEFQVFTFAILLVVYSLALGWDTLTRGPLGFSGIGRPASFRTDDHYFLLVVMITAAVGWLLGRVARAPFGRLLEAARDDEMAVATLGKDPVGLKIKAFTLGSALSGMAGALVASHLRYIDPGTFFLPFLLLAVAMVLVGGLASFPGTILGGVITFGLTTGLRFLPLPPQYLGPLRVMMYAAMLLVVVLARPKGLLGRVEVE